MLILSSQLRAQMPSIPLLDSNYFALPIKHTPRLTGNFGELRDNHFHAGLDFKSSKGRPGDDILSVADGYVSRIKVSMGGYGNTVYINHDCGLTSVYAHLDQFDKTLAAIVQDSQVIHENFEIDINLTSEIFPVKKGQVIGQMGNTGHSYGPHLHFELRQTVSEIPINPLIYGFGITDDKKPEVRALFCHVLDQRQRPIKSLSIPLIKKEGSWSTPSDTLYVNAWRIGLAVDAIDKQNGSSNRNGIFQLEQYVDGQLTYDFQSTHCGFDETRQMNAHIDYGRRQSHRQFVHRCYLLPNNTLSMYDRAKGNGIISLYETKPSHVAIIIKDFHHNADTIHLTLLRAEKEEMNDSSEVFHAFFKYDKSNYYNTPYVSVHCNEDGLFCDLPLVVNTDLDPVGKLHEIRIGQPEAAIKQNFIVDISDEILDTKMKHKACLIYKEHKSGKDRSVGSKVTKTGITCSLPYLGLFQMDYDTVPPTIRCHLSSDIWDRGKTIKWTIKDNYEVIGQAREVRIDSRIGDDFFAAHYDLKSHLLSWTIPTDLIPGEYVFSIKATDDKNNSGMWKRTITIN